MTIATTLLLLDDFRRAIADTGLTPPDEIIADGKLHRFATDEEDFRDDAGWYVLHSDGLPAGVFGCHRSGLKQKWCTKSDQQMTPAERLEHRKRIAAIQHQRDAEERRRHTAAAQRAQTIWDAALLAPPDHPYLAQKQVRPCGLCVDEINNLIVPVLINGALTSLQFIDVDGGKKFLAGGNVKGGSFTIGELTESSSIIAVVEGIATGASVHESTGHPTVCAFSAGNLLPVAQGLRRRYPEAIIVVCGDNDLRENGTPNTGFNSARAAAAEIEGRLAMPDLDGKKCDFNDMARAQGPDAVRETIQAAMAPSPSASSDIPVEPWPVLDPAALYGLAGEIVALLSPHTEADPVALLATLLSEYGCTIGRASHVVLDGSRHPLLFWPLLIGKSSKSRKGSSDRRISGVFQRADPMWTRGEHRGTLSSGEGLVHAVRDPTYKEEPDRTTGELERRCMDSGLADKRLFLVQSEFGAVLRVMHREGNSLSGVLRDAWDGLDLCPMTKNTTIRATQPHVAIVGHTTVDELRRNLTDTEMSNGFGNRFAFFVVKRAQELPEFSEPDRAQTEAVTGRLKAALLYARTADRLTMTAAAREEWIAIYHDLSADRPGVVGALLGRAEAQVQRVAALYCLLDLQRQVDIPHLRAALALWLYAEASTEYLFGNSTGDPDADNILAAIHRAGELSDTEISALFSYNRTQKRLDQAKKILEVAGLVTSDERKTGERGRPVRVWKAKKKST